MKKSPRLLSLCFCLSLLCACAPYKPGEPKSGWCNELNAKLIFSGGTGIDRDAEIQTAEEPLVQRSYDKRCLR